MIRWACFIFLILLAEISSAKHPAIDAAHELLKQRDRNAALKSLNAAIQFESKPAIKSELKAELMSAAEIFLTEKGQNAFESAEIARYSNQPTAQARYEGSLLLEGDNFKILAALALIHLHKNECEKAQGYISRIRQVDAEISLGRYLEVAARICQSPTATTMEDLSLLRPLRELRPVNVGLIAKGEFLRGEFDLSLKAAREAVQLDSKYPTGYYWAYKVLKQKNQLGIEDAEKYVELCRGLVPEQRKRYQWDVDLCKESETIGRALKASEGSK